jgi:hypothetical protein
MKVPYAAGMGLSLLGSNQSLRVTSIVALAFATSVGVACADDPADPSSTGGGGGTAGSSGGKGGTAGTGGASNTGGSAGKGGTAGTGGTSGGTAGTGGTTGGTAGTGGTGGDPGAGGMPGAGGAPMGGEGGMPGAGGDPGVAGMPGAGGDPGAGGMPSGEGGMGGGGTVDPPFSWFTGFETANDGWGPRGSTVNRVTTAKHSGEYSLEVTGRTANWNGTQMSLVSFYTGGQLEAGKQYSISIWASAIVPDPMPDPAPDFELVLTEQLVFPAEQSACGNTNGSAGFSRLAAATPAPVDSWVELKSGANQKLAITVPAGCSPSTYLVYVEAPSPTLSFRIDDVTITEIVP